MEEPSADSFILSYLKKNKTPTYEGVLQLFKQNVFKNSLQVYFTGNLLLTPRCSVHRGADLKFE